LKYKGGQGRIIAEEKVYGRKQAAISDKRKVFNQKGLPLIEGDYILKGPPPEVSHYQAFCGIHYTIPPSVRTPSISLKNNLI
jgi:hypothetical protein